jgi:DNA-binding CsgD family transcriptional regulator
MDYLLNRVLRGGIGLLLFKQTRNSDDIPFVQVTPWDSEDALRERVEQLTGDEAEGYKWIRELYSEQWIAETLMLSTRRTKALIGRICRKLGVRDVQTLLRAYKSLERPGKAPADTEEIDDYIEKRTEAEIQEKLQNR